jgi:hypothetical protein
MLCHNIRDLEIRTIGQRGANEHQGTRFATEISFSIAALLYE